MNPPPIRSRLPDLSQQWPVRRVVVGLKRVRFRSGASLHDVIDRVLHELRLDSLEKRAAYMAFNLTVALFPTIIFLFTLIPYIPVPNLNVDILQFLPISCPANCTRPRPAPLRTL